MKKRSVWLYLGLLMLGLYFFYDVMGDRQEVEAIPYSEFTRLLEEKKVKEVVIAEDQIRGTLTEPRDGRTRFITVPVEAELADKLDRSGVRYSRTVDSTPWRTLVSALLPIFILSASGC